MTNVTTAFGLQPVRRLDDMPWNGGITPCYIAATYASNVFVGDAVNYPGTYASGEAAITNTALVRGYRPGSLMSVELADIIVSAPIYGIVVGFEPLQGADTPAYGKASTERIAQIVRPDNMIFRIKDNGYAALGTVIPGSTAMLRAGTGSIYTGKSGWTLDAGTATAPGTSSTYHLEILSAENRSDNDATLAYCNWLVRVNLSYTQAAVTGN